MRHGPRVGPGSSGVCPNAACISMRLPLPLPLPLLQEAGAKISDALGNPLDFTQGRFFPFLNGGIVAATPALHAQIIAAIAKITAAEQAQQQ